MCMCSLTVSDHCRDADLDSRVGTARASLACEEEVQSLDYTFAEEESVSRST